MHKPFDFMTAFSRNIGWVTEQEQALLRSKRIAIAGLGGGGGMHLMTLARLGIGNFNIADFDTFEIHNFNRQIGATMENIDKPKINVLHDMALAINPEINIKDFPNGITETNIDEFLHDVDLYMDGLDFFELNIREKVFKRCYELGIPAITAAPIGMGTGLLIFLPGKMTFEEYFRFNGLNDEDKYFNFLIGFTPKPISLKYLVDPSAVKLEEKKGPSTIIGVQFSAAVAAAQALKILLNRGKVYPVPYYQFFDAYLSKHLVGKLYFGNKNPIQRLKLFIIKNVIAKARKRKLHEKK